MEAAAALPALMAVERLEEFRAATTETGMEQRHMVLIGQNHDYHESAYMN